MIDRIRYAIALWKAGLYQKRGLFASILSTFCGFSVLAALSPDMLPTFMAQYHTQLVDLGKVATGVGFVAGAVAAQSKAPLPKVPLTGAPSLLDDETGS